MGCGTPRRADGWAALSGAAAKRVHLDTSFLIRALVPESAEAASLGVWISEGRPLAMSALAWGELLCGPLEADDEVLVRTVIRTIVPLDAEAASLAARLFNASGRRRGSFPDCLVAATCLQAGAALATANPMDFQRFAGAGPDLVHAAG